jgi:hypothetical protein
MTTNPQQPATDTTATTPTTTAAPTASASGARSGGPITQITGGGRGDVELPLNDIRVPVTYQATTSFSSENGRLGGAQPSPIPEAGAPASPLPHPKRSNWKQNTPPPSGQGWRGPTRGSGKWLAGVLGIDYKTLKVRHANGLLWAFPVDGKTIDLWAQLVEDDDRLFKAAKAREDAENSNSQSAT